MHFFLQAQQASPKKNPWYIQKKILRMQNLSKDTILDVLNASLAEVSKESRVSAEALINEFVSKL